MAYEKQTWVNNETVITAEMMNHIEDGIEEAEKAPAAPSNATTSTAGLVKMAAAVPDAAAAPTKEEFNALLASLRAAGIVSPT